MLPLYDKGVPLERKPIVVILLIAVNVLIFFYVFSALNPVLTIERFGMRPSEILAGMNYLTLLTALFLHGGLGHLLGNMWFLWLFGDNLEDKLGRFRFLIFYLTVGVIASIAHIYLSPSSALNIPVIGASGAISGVLGGYVALFPGNKVRALVPIFFYVTLVDVPAVFYAIVWFIYQLLIPVGGPTQIAYGAHIGGFLAGLGLVWFFRGKSARLTN